MKNDFENKASSMETLQEIMNNIWGGESRSGRAININTAMQVSAMLAVSKVIIEGIAQVPWKLFLAQNGQRNPATGHPLYRLLHDEPNEYQTSFEFREQIGLHLIFCGEAFVFPNRIRGKIAELLPIEPNLITTKRDGWQREYELRVPGKDLQIISSQDMWHIRAASWDGVKGLDSIRLIREALGLALATEEHGARLFSNGARVGGIYSTEQNPGPEQREKIIESLKQYEGNSAAFKTMLAWGGIKWTPMGSPNDETQFLETRKFQIEEICRAFLVQPVMVGQEGNSASFSSVEQRFLSHVVYTLSPWYQRLEQSANKSLLTSDEKSQGYYTKFIATALMRGAATDRSNYFAKALGSGGSPAWMTQDEVRELEEMNPMGGKAAELREPTNLPKNTAQNNNQNAGQ
jgi:HK97 family phage portal protein